MALANAHSRLRGGAVAGAPRLHRDKPDVFVDMKFTNADATQPSLCHVIFSNVQSVDFYRIGEFSSEFMCTTEAAAAALDDKGDYDDERFMFGRGSPHDSSVVAASRNWCTVNGAVPRAYLKNCIVRTFAAEMYECQRQSINIVFMFSIYPAVDSARTVCPSPSSNNDHRRRSQIQRVVQFPTTIRKWIEHAGELVVRRANAQQVLEGRACDSANFDVLREMVRHVFLKTLGSRIIQPEAVDVMWMSASMRNSRAARHVQQSKDAGTRHNMLGTEYSSDVIVRIFWKMPLYVDNVVRRWNEQYPTHFGNGGSRAPWRHDERWNLVNIVADQAGVCDNHGNGPLYLCLVYIDNHAVARAAIADNTNAASSELITSASPSSSSSSSTLPRISLSSRCSNSSGDRSRKRAFSYEYDRSVETRADGDGNDDTAAETRERRSRKVRFKLPLEKRVQEFYVPSSKRQRPLRM